MPSLLRPTLLEEPKEDRILVHEKRYVTLGQQLVEASDPRPCELMCQPLPEFTFDRALCWTEAGLLSPTGHSLPGVLLVDDTEC